MRCSVSMATRLTWSPHDGGRVTTGGGGFVRMGGGGERGRGRDEEGEGDDGERFFPVQLLW